MKWRPIETAPKDGTLILVHEAGGRIQTARWDAPGYEEPDWYVDLTQLGFSDGYPTTDVTHWMPLPEPPEGEDDGDT